MRALALLLLAAIAAPASAVTPEWLDLRDLHGVATPDMRQRLGVLDLEDAAEWPFGFGVPFSSVTARLRADGTVTRRITSTRTLGTQEAARNHANLVRSVRTELETLKVLDAYTLPPTGPAVPLDPSTIQISTPAQRDIYSDVRNVTFPMPRACVGCHLVLVTEETFRQDLWPFAWSMHVATRLVAPVARLLIRVEWEDGEAPAHATNDEALRCWPSERAITCSRSNSPPMLLDAVVDSYHELSTEVVFSREKSWGDLARRVSDLVRSASGTSADLRAVATRLTSATTRVIENATMLHRFVADEIRYVGMEHGTSAVVPIDAPTSLDRGYADCKGKVALFLSLAEGSDILAEPVLVALDYRRPESMLLPSALYFDHMIVCARGTGPSPLCMDLTANGIETGALPSALIGAIAIRPSRPEPYSIPAPGPTYRATHTNHISVACDGIIDEHLERSFRGAWAGSLRASLGQASRSDRIESLVSDYETTVGKPENLEIEIQRLRDAEHALVIDSRARFRGTNPEEWTSYRDVDSWLVSYLRDYLSDNERHPFRVWGTRIGVEHVIDVCSDWRISHLGPSLDLAGPGGTLARTYSVDGNVVRISTELEMLPREIPAEESKSWNRFIHMLQNEARFRFGLDTANSTHTPDAPTP